MTPYINAWLDCHSPHITVNDKKTGELLVHYNKKEMTQLFSNGDISLEELQSTDATVQEELIIDLLLFKSAQTIQQQMTKVHLSLKLREPITDAKKNVAVLTTVPNKPNIQQTLKNLVAFPSSALQQAG